MNLVANIKTIPFFRFYHMHNSLFYPVLMFIKESAILGQERKIQLMSSLLSGEWSIVGFKHHIGQDDIYSQFTLIRTPASSHAVHSVITKEKEE